MASKTIQDLPDPLQPSRVPSAASTDDMLARMADEAIDQLMAEADRDEFLMRSPLSATRPADAASAHTAELPVDEPVAPMPPSVDPLAAVLDQRVETQAIAALLAEAAEQSATGEPQDDLPVGDFSDAPIDTDPPESAADVKALLAEHEPHASSKSLATLPLRAVNAPFRGVSDSVRNAIGQVAILTMINAIAVLIYVLVFRRHH